MQTLTQKPSKIKTYEIYFIYSINDFCFLNFLYDNKNFTTDQQAPNEKKMNIELKHIIGKTYEFNYSEEFVYHIKFESDSTVNWKLVKGEFPGASEETDKFISTKISDNVLFISWVEKSGLGYSNIMDFNTNILTTHARQDNSVFVNPGKFKEVK